ncbi:unnamed protein product [Ascophyllum nodosum]
MACPFAQLSPLLLLSFLVLFLQFGASFFSPKPIIASLHRGRSMAGSTSSRSRGASPPPHHQGSRTGSGATGGRTEGDGSSGARMLNAAVVLAPPEKEVSAEEDIEGDPFPWTESLSSGEPLLYSGLLRWQVSALQIGLGLDRLPCPSGLGAVFNVEKKARARNLVYAGGRVRKLRMSYLDSPGMQVFTSIAYGSKGHDFPLLGVSTMAMGRARFVALDLQPLFAGDAYTAKYSEVYSRMKAIRNKYPQMGQELQKDYFKGSPFFSDKMLYARWGPDDEASGFMQNVVVPAFQECVQVYIDLVNSAPEPEHAPGSAEERAILERQAEFDRFHAEREQVRPVMTSNFGSAWTDSYISKFLFAYGGGKR